MGGNKERNERWFMSPFVDSQVAISARIRFARNFEDYPFPMKITGEDARKMAKETADAVLGSGFALDEGFRFFDISNNPIETLLPLMERHVLSSQLAQKQGVKGLLLNSKENLSIMLNEEDHIRIQSIYPGDNIDNAYESAEIMEAMIEERGCRYAYDHEYGYLTSCPTNTGTGLRASLMLHLPALEASKFISKLVPALGKFGMTVRGIHGEGSESLGAVYQLSNQITLGKSEQEILQQLKSSAAHVISQENNAREKLLTENGLKYRDRLYRSYGILKHCRSLDIKEGMDLLSDVRIGFLSRIYEMDRPDRTIYGLMMDIQPGNLAAQAGKTLTSEELNVYRADFIREAL
ncbi:MAG: protein arginine kinase [Clostridiales bacterium]|jgi:protein arginine kinase|nr:protein arginine kinase [Clostridiales bacterium]